MMFNDRSNFNSATICRWLSLLCALSRYNVQALTIPMTHAQDNEIGHGHEISANSKANAEQPDVTVPNFSPRLEYNNEWRPVGRGDPLKNDPTYDYSPPALERVRYWRAENETKEDVNIVRHHKKEFSGNENKDAIMLGMPNERQRGQTMHSETAILHPKYTSIRRSYYAHQHQLPTHLMPPPMQTLVSPMNSMKTSVASEYRHSVHPSTTTISMMNSKPLYSTSSSLSSPWVHSLMHSSLPAMTSSSPASLMQHYKHDHNRQESINQFTYTRPPYHPDNFVESNQISAKPRKPWLHELLQKEVVKAPPKPTSHRYSSNYESMIPSSMAIGTTYPPLAFVPLPTVTTATTKIPQTTASTTTQSPTTTSPVYFTTTLSTVPTRSDVQFMSSSVAPPPQPTSNRLLIPTTSNLVHRPTVTPMEMTTDALFKHYKQPMKPLLGPMYLIIEGHSKVKTYGKDELDPHRPKIVPIIPKREPVVRIADPNEKRGTLETFKVKHLHTKVTEPLLEATQSTSTPIPTTTATAPHTSTKIPTSSTKRTVTKPSKVSFSVATNTTKTTSTTTSTTTPATTEKTKQNNSTSTTEPSSGVMQGFFSFLDSSLGSIFHEDARAPVIETNNTAEAFQHQQIFVTTPPSATVLHPVAKNAQKSPEIEARIGGSSERLIDLMHEDMGDDKVTTETIPRDVRQVFDYDQLPESRLKDRIDVDTNKDDDDDASVSEEGFIELHDDSIEDIDMDDVETLAHDEYEDENHELLKRIDKFVDNIDEIDDDHEETEFEDLVSAEAESVDDLEMRQAKEA